MKQYNETRIAIIGFGFLMGYLYECYEKFLGIEGIKTNVVAVTADVSTIEEKRKKYPFEILLNDNLSALREIKPDIILFAPPPVVAPDIIKNELKTYFSECIVKPDIYAFPPSPDGKFYIDILGNDIFVCNILPNMVREIGGKPLNGEEGYSTLTYPEGVEICVSKRKRLEDFLRPLGGTVEISPDRVMDVLASYVMIDLWPHRLIKAAKILGYNDHRDILNDRRQIEGYVLTISEAIVKFLVDRGLPKDKAVGIVKERNHLVFHLSGETSEKELYDDMRTHSTKGGVFEKGLNLHGIVIDNCSIMYFDGNESSLPESIYYCLEIISTHGDNLASSMGNEEFHPGIHAMVFALFVRKIRELDRKESENIIRETVMSYGTQRGKRMRKRAELAGYNGSMEDYMSFGEWTADEGSMEIITTQGHEPAITRVYKCPWVTEWKKFGFIREGENYCRYVDKALVKGFNEALVLDMNSVKSQGDEFCEFIWNGAAMDGIKKIEEKGRIMPWKYHIAHLMDSIESNYIHGKDILDSIEHDISVLYGVNLSIIKEEYRDYDFSSV